MLQEENDFPQQLEALPHPKKMLFLASCVERRVPFYTSFCLSEQWPRDPFLLRRALDTVWNHLKVANLNQSEIYKWIVLCEDAQIDPHDSNYFLMYGALGAAPAMALLFRLCLQENNEQAEQIREIAVDERFHFVCCVNSSPSTGFYTDDFLDQMWQSPLMKAEWQKQGNDLTSLAANEPSVSYLEQFQQNAQIGGIDPFGRGLVPDTILKKVQQQRAN